MPSEAPLTRAFDRPCGLARASLWLPPLLAALLLLPALGNSPGLHGDEAWVAFRVRELAEGARPWNGMTFYTGALHQYITWPFVHGLGESALALRLSGAVLSLLAVVAAAWGVRQLAGERTALACAVLIASAPSVLAYARFAIEVAALTPFLTAFAFAAFAWAARARRGRSTKPVLAALAGGALLGVAAYNHAVALPIALAAAAVALVVRGLALLRSPLAYAAVAGFALGFSPRLVALAKRVEPLFESGEGPSFVADLPYLPWIIARTWDGSLIYQRFVGDSGLAWPYPVLALMLLLLLHRVVCVRTLPAGRWAPLLAFVAACSVLTVAIAPHAADRYFIAVMWVVPAIPGWLAQPLLEHPQRRLRCAAAALIASVVVINIATFIASFLAPFERHGGGLSTFPVGRRLVETSNHFVRTDRLYGELRRRGITRVYANFFIAMPLRVHDRERALQIIRWEHPYAPPVAGAADVASAVVLYGDGAPVRALGGGSRFVHDAAFPPHFQVYVDPVSRP